ncbi:OadG family protein [Chondrinema litorale]|uniref:OadG family protein n=1 Tax=Chondrinema litorale TaxID=2994555 RepID=UPI002542E01D|nr:OadG family protein [Chondrinema litorale]UZR93501.1 OadG family protein [Chondrinema litorale]
MEGNFGTAFMLLLVGMITVFSVLFFVVLLGKALIRLVNALHKEIPVAAKPVRNQTNSQQLTPNKLAALVAAVDVVTVGKGHITSIEKID